MGSRFFSRGIFGEYFRQLRIVGIIGTVIYLLLGFFVPIGINISMANIVIDSKYPVSSIAIFNIEPEIIGADAICAVQLLIPVLFVPLLMLVAFHFLTKRSNSDFYHALPVKREAMYVGIIAAVLAWTLIIMLLPLITMWFIGLSLKYVQVPFADVLKATANILASSLFMMGVFALGINLSGTVFTNITTSLIVMLLPRLIIILCYLVSDTLVIGSAAEFTLSELMVKSNPITKFVYIMADGYVKPGYIMRGVAPGIIEGLVYTLAGGLLFKYRRSEVATASCYNNVVQTAIRHIISLLLSTVGSLIAVYSFEDLEVINLFFVFMFYVLAIVIYFMYELIITRKWKAVVKSAKQLPVNIAIAAVILIFIIVHTESENSYRINPDKADIKVSEITGYGMGMDTLLGVALPARIVSDEARQLVADSYNDKEYYSNRVVGYIVATVREKGISHRRSIYLDERAFKSVVNDIMDNNEVDLKKLVPELDSGTRVSISWNWYMSGIHLENKECIAIYKTLRDEILDGGNIAGLLIAPDKAICYVWIYSIGIGHYECEIPVSTATPRTLDYIMQLLFAKEDLVGFVEMYDEYAKAGDGYNKEIDCGFTLYSEKLKISNEFYLERDGESWEDVRDILAKYDRKGSVNNDNAVVVSGNAYYYNEDEDEGHEMLAFGIYNLSDEDMAKLVEIIHAKNTIYY